MTPHNKTKKVLWAIILSVFVFSLAYSLYFRVPPAVDARAYDNIAWNLVRGNGYKENAVLDYDTDIAILRVGPGYEFFLAAVYYIFGHHYQIVWLIHAILSALSALLTFLLSREVFGYERDTIGLVAASFIGFSPDLITVNGLLLSETLGICLLVLSVYLFFRYINVADKKMPFLILTALIFGAAALVRTPIVLLFVPFAGYLVLQKRWRHLAIMSFLLLAVFLPWTIRNYQIYHSFIPTNLAFGYDLLAGNHPAATGELEPYDQNEQFMEEHGRIEGNKLALSAALNFIFQNPIEFIKITLYRVSIYFSFARPTGFWFHLEGWSKAITLMFSAIYSIILFVLGFWGIYKIRELPPDVCNKAKLFLIMLVMMPVAIVGIIVETRYRFLSYPFFAVFAGYALADLFSGGVKNWRPMLAIGGILLANTAFDVLHNVGRILERLREFI